MFDNKKSGAYLSAWSFAGLLSSFSPEKRQNHSIRLKRSKSVFIEAGKNRAIDSFEEQ
jgi:hypothetical protein